MTTVYKTPQDKARIKYLVDYWNTVNFDSRVAEDYDLYEVVSSTQTKTNLYNRNLETHHVHTVHLSSSRPGVEKLSFVVSPEVKRDLEAIGNKVAQHQPIPKPVGGMPIHLPPKPITVELRNIPARAGDKTHIRTYAFKCNTCEDDRFWCGHVGAKFAKWRDHEEWIRQVNRVATKGGDGIYLAVPLFSFLFHRVLLRKELLTDWEGNKTYKLLVDPCLPGLLSESFKELDNKDIIWQLGLQMTELLRSETGRFSRGSVDRFIDGGSLACGAKQHGYGKGKQLKEWFAKTRDLESDHQTEPKSRALAWTLLAYNCCYFCWLDSEMAFSTLPV